MRLFLVASLVLVLVPASGCLDDRPPAAGTVDAPAPDSLGQDAAPCTPARQSNDGTRINDHYVDGGEVWRETNGVENLQRAETCEGPADTRIA